MTARPMEPQPHGGALRRDGNPGNAGGNGRSRVTVPASIVPEDAAKIAADELPGLVKMAARIARDRKQPKAERMRAAAFVHQVAGAGKLTDLPGARKPSARVTTVSPAEARAGLADLTESNVTRTAPAAVEPPEPAPTDDTTPTRGRRRQ